jgi:putative NADH dependent butanol dehydrogenase A
MTWMTEHNVGKIAQYAIRVWGVAESDDKKAVALEGISRLKSFFTSIGLPVTFKELGIENPDIDRLADSLHRNKGELVGNYVKLAKRDSKEIYRLAL